MSRKIWNVIAGTGLILGGLVSLTPFKLAPLCEKLLTLASGTKVHMVCNWTGRAEVIMGFIVIVTSLLILISKKEASKRALGIMLGILGVAIIIIPTSIGIGICANPSMDCHTTAKFLDVWGAALILLGGVSLFKGEEKVKDV